MIGSLVRTFVVSAGLAAGGYGMYQILMGQGMLLRIAALDGLRVPVLSHAGLSPLELGGALLAGGMLLAIAASIWRPSRA